MSFAAYQWPNEHQSQEVHHISNPYGFVQSQSWGSPGQKFTRQQHQQSGPQGHLQLNRYGNYYHKYSLPLSHYCYPGREIGYHVANSGGHSKGQFFNDNICRIPYDISSNRQLFRENNCLENYTQRPSQYQSHNTEQGITKTGFYIP